jgi:hypothetical protein
MKISTRNLRIADLRAENDSETLDYEAKGL